MPPVTGTYASDDALTAELTLAELAENDADARARLLRNATRDVDEVLGPLYVLGADAGDYVGRKLNPANLTDEAAGALERATVVQAIHRLRHVEPASTAGARVVTSVKGPDFEQTFADSTGPVGVSGSGRFSPELRRELEPLAYLRPTGARARP